MTVVSSRRHNKVGEWWFGFNKDRRDRIGRCLGSGGGDTMGNHKGFTGKGTKLAHSLAVLTLWCIWK